MSKNTADKDSDVQRRARRQALTPWFMKRSVYTRRVPMFVEILKGEDGVETGWRNYAYLPRAEKDRERSISELQGAELVLVCWITPTNLAKGVRLPDALGAAGEPLILQHTQTVADTRIEETDSSLQLQVRAVRTGPPRSRQVYPDVAEIITD